MYYPGIPRPKTSKKRDELTKLKNRKSKFEKRLVEFGFVVLTAFVRRMPALFFWRGLARCFAKKIWQLLSTFSDKDR